VPVIGQHPDGDRHELRRRLRGSLARTPPPTGLPLLCRSIVAEVDLTGATITLMVDAGPQGVAATSDPDITAADAAQFDVGEGPSRDAFSAGQPVLVYDLTRTDGRWPAFVSGALARGIGAVYAFPLQLGAVRLGVLTCYSGRPRALGNEELSVCAIYAEVATGYLIDQSSGTATTTPGLDEFLAAGVQIPTVVYQAQGMLTVDLDIGLADALARMRATAFAEGISLNELAADIVADRRRLHRDKGDAGGPGPALRAPDSSDG
jgi:GAF domain-containing protein